ncbi:MAG: HesA/MoeB/ThiF family protein [Eubacteriales bacterium]|nr:HesA/MoeB/ThiF family protein [Eubacteriales bacterium]
MQHRYDRNLGALTKEECAILKSKRVFVAGCGGIGGYVIELMARIGIGGITAADGDVFEETNLNRQLLCEEGLLGTSKALAAKARVEKINSGVTAEAVEAYITAENAEGLLLGHDIVIDALDSIPARRILAKACAKLHIPLVHGAIGGWCAQISVIMPGEDTMRILYPEDADASVAGNPSFTPALAASVEAAEAVKVLLGRESTLAGKLLCIDLLSGTYQTVQLF